jgi:hypothetical protein
MADEAKRARDELIVVNDAGEAGYESAHARKEENIG